MTNKKKKHKKVELPVSNETEIEIQIKKKISDKENNSFYASDTINFVFKNVTSISIMALIVFFYKDVKSGKIFTETISIILGNLIGITLAITSYLFYKNAKPNTNTDIHEWTWKKARLFFIGSFCVTILLFIDQVFGTVEKNTLRFFSYFFQGLFIILISLLTILPRYILSSFYTNFASGVFIFNGILLMLSFLSDQNIFFTTIIFLIVTLFLITLVSDLSNPKSLNLVQKMALNFIRPEKILIEIARFKTSLNDEIKAMSLIKKYEAKGDFAFNLALLTVLLPRYSKKSSKFYGFVLSLFIFILGVTFEPFFQKILYENYILPFLCKSDFFHIILNCK